MGLSISWLHLLSDYSNYLNSIFNDWLRNFFVKGFCCGFGKKTFVGGVSEVIYRLIRLGLLVLAGV